MKTLLKEFFNANIDVFAWKCIDMIRIDLNIACHAMEIDPKTRPKMQKWQSLSSEKYEVLKSEVNQLLENDFIREAQYWV